MKKRTNRNKTNEMLPIIMIAAGALLVITVLLLQVFRSPQPSTAGADIPEPGIQRVTLADSKAAFDNQSALFLDVRDAGAYEAGHIPGAVNIPMSELETRLGELDPNRWIITYCT